VEENSLWQKVISFIVIIVIAVYFVMMLFSYMSIVESQPTYGIHYYEVKVCIIVMFADLIVAELVDVHFSDKLYAYH